MHIPDTPDVEPVHAPRIELMREVPFDFLAPLPLHPLAPLSPNAPPVAVNDNYSVVQNNTLNVDANSGVLANDITYGGGLSATLASQPASGTVVFDSNGAFEYEPNTGFIGADVFTYEADDGEANSNLAAVFIDVLDPHPTAYADSYSVVLNMMLNVDASAGVLANDFSPGGGAMTATLVSGTSNGSLILNSDGSFVYDPNNSFEGTDTFTYRAVAAGYQSNTATVSIYVREPMTLVNPSFELDGIGNYITCHSGVGIGWTTVNNWIGVDIYCGAPGACVARSPLRPVTVPSAVAVSTLLLLDSSAVAQSSRPRLTIVTFAR